MNNTLKKRILLLLLLNKCCVIYPYSSLVLSHALKSKVLPAFPISEGPSLGSFFTFSQRQSYLKSLLCRNNKSFCQTCSIARLTKPFPNFISRLPHYIILDVGHRKQGFCRVLHRQLKNLHR